MRVPIFLTGGKDSFVTKFFSAILYRLMFFNTIGKHQQMLTWSQLIQKLSTAPAQIAGLEAGTLRVGGPADVALIDPAARWTVDPQRFASKGRHSPFAGRTLTAVVVGVFVRGHEVTAQVVG